MAMNERLSWAEISAGLEEYRRDGLAEALRRLLDAKLPANGKLDRDWRRRRPLLEATNRLIAERSGAWYPGAGTTIYSEQLGGACACHSFCGLPRDQELSREQAIAHSVRGILAEVDRVYAWLTDLDAFYQALSLPSDPAERLVALEEATELLLDLILLHTEAWDCWYPLITDACVWMAECVGVRVTFEDKLSVVVHRYCTSWQAPTPQQRVDLHAELAELLYSST